MPWGTIEPQSRGRGAESGVATCFFGHSQLWTEASQEAVEFKRKVSFTLTKSMIMKTLGEAWGPRAPRGSWWQNRRAMSPAAQFSDGQAYPGEAAWKADPIPEGGTSALLPALPPAPRWPASGAGSTDSGSQLDLHEQKCSFGFPVGTPRAGMFWWFSCWNPRGRNVLVGFLLEFHEKRFHSPSLVPLKIPGHGTLGQAQVQPPPPRLCPQARGLSFVWMRPGEGRLGRLRCCC